MALTQDYTFQYKDDGIILNGDIDPSDPTLPFVDVTGVTGLDSGEFRVQDRTYEGGDGGFMDSGFKDMRVVVISATIYGDESYLEQLRANWKPFKRGENGFVGGYPFYYSADGLYRKVIGRSLGMQYDWAQLRRTGRTEAQFQLKCEDPTIYDAATKESQHLSLLPITVSGYGYPRGYPRTYGGGLSGGGGVNVSNNGTAISYPQITINGPCDNPYIINDSWPTQTLPRIKLAGSLGVGDQIVIDMLYRTIRLNGTANRRNWISPPYDWWGLLPGDNFIRFGADTLSGAEAYLTYSDALE
jgi:hypothetical protein